MLNRLFLVACFFPFVSPYPVGTDIQPVAGLLGLLVIIKTILLRAVSLRPQLITVVAIPIFLLGYNFIVWYTFSIEVGKVVSLVYGVVVLIAFIMSKTYITSKLLVFVVFTYFLMSVFILIDPSGAIMFQNHFIRTTNSVEFTYRGISSFVTEPGLFGGVLLFLLMVCHYYYKANVLTVKTWCMLCLMLIIMLLLTKSGMGYLYFLIYLMFAFVEAETTIIKKAVFVSCLLVTLSVLIIFSGDNLSALGRGGEIISRLANPSILLTTDMSVLTRVIDVYTGIYSVFNYPFGVGNGAVTEAVNRLSRNSDLINDFYISTGKDIGLTSSFSYMTVAYGLIFWMYIYLLYFVYSQSRFCYKFFSFLFLTVSFSAAFPAIWILLGLNSKNGLTIKVKGEKNSNR